MTRSGKSPRILSQEGFLVALTLDDRRLRLRLLRVFTLGRVWLKDVRYIRQRGGWEAWRLLGDFIWYPFRSWYWPRVGVKRGVHHSTAFMIRLRSGRRVYVRLRPGFHHRLRTAIGTVRVGDDSAE